MITYSINKNISFSDDFNIIYNKNVEYCRCNKDAATILELLWILKTNITIELTIEMLNKAKFESPKFTDMNIFIQRIFDYLKKLSVLALNEQE